MPASANGTSATATSAGNGAPAIAAAARHASAAASPTAARRGSAQPGTRRRTYAPRPRPSSATDSAVDVACELPMYANSRVEVSSRTSTTNVTIAIVAAGTISAAGETAAGP